MRIFKKMYYIGSSFKLLKNGFKFKHYNKQFLCETLIYEHNETIYLKKAVILLIIET
jgi:hypothetical protein